MAAYADLVRFTSISNGTGPMALQAVVEGYQAPSAAIFDGQVVEYTIVNPITPLEKETGIGTWSNANQALTRLTPRATSSFSTASGNALVPFSLVGTKTVTFGLTSHGIALVAGGGTSLKQVASAPGTYEFVAGGQYNVSYADRRHAYLKVLGPDPSNLLTATMYIALPDPADGPEGYRIVYEKGDSSVFNVVGVGFSASVPVTANLTTDFLSFTGYTPADGDPFILRRGTAPGGLSLGIVYFARDSSGSTCKVAGTIGGSAIDLVTTAGSGFVAFKGRKSLTRIDQYQGARIVGTSVRRWEFVEGGQQAFSSFGQDLMKAADAAAAQTLLGPVTSIADSAIVLADLEDAALTSLANTRPGVVDVLSGLTLVNEFSPPYGLSPTIPGPDVVSLRGLGSASVELTPVSGPGRITAHTSGAVRFNTTSAIAYLTKAGQSIASDFVTFVVAVMPVTIAGSLHLYSKHDHNGGFGVDFTISSTGSFSVSVYTAVATVTNVFTTPWAAGILNIIAFTYNRATGAFAWSKNSGTRYGSGTGTIGANWSVPLQSNLGIFVGQAGASTCEMVWFGAKEYTSSSVANRLQLEALVRDMEQHAVRKIGHGDLALPLLQTVETTSAVARGIGSAGILKSAWVSGFGVTGGNPVTGVTESHGLGTALTVSGSPALQTDGAVRIVCNGATSSGLLSKGPPLTDELLTNRNILVMDVNADVAGDWNVASLFRAFDSTNNYGFNLTSAGIIAYASSGPITSAFTPKRGRQRIGVYIEFGPTSSFRYISVGRDQNDLARAPFKVAATFSTGTQIPSGIDTLLLWVGEGNLIAGRAGTHDIYGWRLLNGVPSGLSADAIDALLLGEIKKLERESDPLLRSFPVPPNAQLSDEIANTAGTVVIDPTTSTTRFYSVTATLTANLTIDLSISGQQAGPPVFIVWEGVNGSFKLIVDTHSGETVELTSTGWIVACYLDTSDPSGVSWRTMGRYKKNDEITGSKFTRTINNTISPTVITANAAFDQTILLLRGSGTSAVSVSLAQNSGSNTQIVLVKETNGVITVSVGGSATYRLPGDDDGVTRNTSFVLTGTATLIGDSGSWMVIGSTDHATTLFGALDAADKVISRAVLKDAGEIVVALGTVNSAALSFDFSAGNVQTFTTGSSNYTSVDVTNPPISGVAGALTLIVTQGATARTITFDSTFRFIAGTNSTLTASAGAVDIFTLLTVNGGTNWYVFEGGKNWLP